MYKIITTVHLCGYVFLYVFVYMSVRVHVCMYVYLCVCVYIIIPQTEVDQYQV